MSWVQDAFGVIVLIALGLFFYLQKTGKSFKDIIEMFKDEF